MADKKFPNLNKLDLSQRKEFDVKINVKEILPAVVRTALDSFLRKPSVGTVAQLLKTTGFVSNKEQQAFELLLESLMKAIADQLKDYFQKIEESEEDYFYEDEMLRFDVFGKLESLTFDINYLSHPRGIPFLKAFGKLYQTWLIDNLQMLPEEAAFHTNNFSDYFAYAFYRELVIQPGRYADLKEYYDNPDRKRLTLVVNRNYYKQELRSYFHKHTLGEDKIILKQVYIQPSFQVYKPILSPKKQEYLGRKYKIEDKQQFYPTDYANDIHHYFLNYFTKKKKSYAIDSDMEQSRLLFLLGQPGHGKSSFCYKAMDDLMGNTMFRGDVFFCRLRRAKKVIFDTPSETLIHLLEGLVPKEVGIDVQAYDWFKSNEIAGLSTILFLDGLDELRMAQSLGEEELRIFISNCKELVEDYDNLYIVITSRFNYVEIGKCYNADCLILELGVLTKENQIDLLERHQQLNPRKMWHFDRGMLEKIHKDSDLHHIKELIALPILMQMVLLSGVDIEKHQSRAAIYGHLFDRIIDRKWTKEKRSTKYDYRLETKDLRAYLSWLAYKIYQNGDGYLTRQQIEQNRKTKVFIEKAVVQVQKEKHFRNALKDVLILFYLNETKTSTEKGNGNYAIEFLHKSLYEYLMCEYLWTEVKHLFLEKHTQQPFSEVVLKDVQELFSLIKLSYETREYLKEIMGSEAEQQHHDILMENMSYYLPDLLKYGWLYQYKMPKKKEDKFYTAEKQALNVCYNYILIWSELGKHKMPSLDEFFELNWDIFWRKKLRNMDTEPIEQAWTKQFETNAKTDIIPLIKHNHLPQIEEIALDRRKMWLRGYVFKQYGQQLYQVKIQAVNQQKDRFVRWLRLMSSEALDIELFFPFLNLRRVKLNNVNLCGVNFIGADLSNATIDYTDLSSSNLQFVNLSNAHISNTYIGCADLSNANLSKVNLLSANLESANLYGVDFSNAVTSNVSLREVHLANVNFSGIMFMEVNLDRAQISDLNFLKTTTIYSEMLENMNSCYRTLQDFIVYSDRYGEEYQAYEILRKSPPST